MNKRREEIEHEASGDGLRERRMRGVVEGSVVQWTRMVQMCVLVQTQSSMNLAERNAEPT
jgi:hypothetical protein